MKTVITEEDEQNVLFSRRIGTSLGNGYFGPDELTIFIKFCLISTLNGEIGASVMYSGISDFRFVGTSLYFIISISTMNKLAKQTIKKTSNMFCVCENLW